MISKKLAKIVEEDKKYLFQNYGNKRELAFIYGENSILFDQDNKRYIDFFSGIAVNNLGYNNQPLIKNLKNQLDKILHSSNWFYNKEQIEAAKLLSETAFAGKSLFVNSGTEANEAAIKLARKYGLSKDKKRYEIITFQNSFHGRTFGGMAATGQKKIYEGFGSVLKGFKHLPYNDFDTLEKEIKKNKNITAIMLELIQGEGGIVVAEKDFVKKTANLCKKKDILLIIDEIQTGVGRTGKMFAFQHYNIQPDIITIAKGLGGGIPIGALHAKDFLNKYLLPGTHGTTFGGNHFASKAASSVLKEIKKDSLQKKINKNSEFIFDTLKKWQKSNPNIKSIRGMGFHIGIEVKEDCMKIIQKAEKLGLIINCTAGNIIRIMPPLNIDIKTIKEGMKILEKSIKEVD